jgi:DNA sulfur modification protein DndE
MLINIRTSEETEAILVRLSNRFNLASKNILMRMALGYSLSRNERLDLKKLEDARGKDYKDITVLSERYRSYYIALICQHYNLYKTDPDIGKYVKMHIDDGLRQLNNLFDNNPTHTFTDFLVQNIEQGISALDGFGGIPGTVTNYNQRVQKGHFEGPLTIEVGTSLADGAVVRATFNDKNLRNNAHIAVAGNSGTGKTQFALELLRQFADVSGGSVNFVYLDFKGLKQDDQRQLQPFFERTRTTLIDAPQTPFPLNPLTFIDNVNEKNRLMGISKFVDIIATYAPRIGPAQAQTLKEATKEAFARKRGGEYPTLRDVADCLFEVTNGKADSLTQIIQSLSEYELFAPATDPKESFVNRNYYFSLSGDLDRTIRFTATFLTINYIYNTFMNLENAPVVGDYQAIRYVLLIDEAHTLFKEKKAQDLLEKFLREIRSKGVIVVLLSQGIDEFNQPGFDFSSMCENGFLLDIKDKNLKQMTRFLGLSDRDGVKLTNSMERIQKGQAVSNLKDSEFKKGELFVVKQYWKG